MKAISGKQLAKVLKQHGWECLRVHGSHHIFGKPESTVRLSVPIHGNRALKIGLLKHLINLASLTEDDF